MSEKSHIFEVAGLGKYPYRLNRWFDAGKCATMIVNGVPNGSSLTCDYCGTLIRYIYELISADGKVFIVGSDCINKADDAGLKRIVSQMQAEAKRKKHQDEWEWALATYEHYAYELNEIPHPYAGYGGNLKNLTAYDYIIYCIGSSRYNSTEELIIRLVKKAIKIREERAENEC